MARLKGGKLLIDLSYDELGAEPILQLTEEQIGAILNKGLSLKINTGVISYVIDVIFVHQYEDSGNIILESGRLIDENENEYVVALQVTEKQLMISMQ